MIKPDSPDANAGTLDQHFRSRKGLCSHVYNCINYHMTDPCFFGYGSLVNRKTHAYGDCKTASISGWKRAWCRVAGRDLAILSAVPCPNSTIEGLVASVPNADWDVLDEREKLYLRQTIQIEKAPVAIYEIAAENRNIPSDKTKILLSYLDVVVQGYLAEFGKNGVSGFFETTDNWHAPLLNDRAKPIYPRAQNLNQAEVDLVNWHTKNLNLFVD